MEQQTIMEQEAIMELQAFTMLKVKVEQLSMPYRAPDKT